MPGAEPTVARANSEAEQVTVYDADPAHLWNRLHGALFVRKSSDNKNYGRDVLDPLLWPRSKNLLAGKRHMWVVALLDEFLATDGHKLVKDPLKRAVFQHDLWAVFDWLANPNAPYKGVGWWEPAARGPAPRRWCLWTATARRWAW